MTSRLVRLDHVQLAMPAGREPDAVAFYAGLLGLAEVPKPPVLAARGGCWFEHGGRGRAPRASTRRSRRRPRPTPPSSSTTSTRSPPRSAAAGVARHRTTTRSRACAAATSTTRSGTGSSSSTTRRRTLSRAGRLSAAGAKVTGRRRAMGCRPPRGQSRCPSHRPVGDAPRRGGRRRRTAAVARRARSAPTWRRPDARRVVRRTSSVLVAAAGGRRRRPHRGGARGLLALRAPLHRTILAGAVSALRGEPKKRLRTHGRGDGGSRSAMPRAAQRRAAPASTVPPASAATWATIASPSPEPGRPRDRGER